MDEKRMERVGRQLERFMGKIASGELKDMPIAERGVLYTLIGFSAEDNVIGVTEQILPETVETVRKHLKWLVDRGYVEFRPEDAGRQISKRHYVVHI